MQPKASPGKLGKIWLPSWNQTVSYTMVDFKVGDSVAFFFLQLLFYLWGERWYSQLFLFVGRSNLNNRTGELTLRSLTSDLTDVYTIEINSIPIDHINLVVLGNRPPFYCELVLDWKTEPDWISSLSNSSCSFCTYHCSILPWRCRHMYPDLWRKHGQSRTSRIQMDDWWHWSAGFHRQNIHCKGINCLIRHIYEAERSAKIFGE